MMLGTAGSWGGLSAMIFYRLAMAHDTSYASLLPLSVMVLTFAMCWGTPLGIGVVWVVFGEGGVVASRNLLTKWRDGLSASEWPSPVWDSWAF